MEETRGTAQLIDLLEKAGVQYAVLDHPRTETAAAEAAALGLPPSEVIKTIVIDTPSGRVRAVLPASSRLDLHKLREALDAGKDLRFATEEELEREYAEFELGAVPPFGGDHPDRVIVDSQVAKSPSVVFEAGSHEKSVRLQTADLVALAKAEIADISQQ